MTPSKNHTISKFAAKLLVRLFILLLLFAFAPAILEQETVRPLGQTFVYIEHKWAFIFPGLLFLCFLALLILTLRHRYQKTDLNWMLSLNTLLLIIYVIMLYARLYPLIFG
ncbi:hypothetical protein JHJ32_07200 [Parapedobacter sp. ISTM3]|uniref:Uncharacterized protein n=1 Tax=Parapedobacter luteus TaxID=623280 RepID=A0A1T5BSS9_9SPHI|nr:MULTISPECIES: hypothetical protein [Parapedobacter]MBK1439764.1 hypothetical protein [Parapedobacter sp. ISTM3]SKB50328.1 hypothetical protein SAMN05660226_01721 [Parapedobacter luteus]